jgi:hypothetical protein
MSLRPKWQNIRKRDWSELREAWLSDVPSFPRIGAAPDPPLEDLMPLLQLQLPQNQELFADVVGLRKTILWEAIFLFHKCAHTNMAAQRLSLSGMQSWSLFNSYHSAYLGARGILSLLGVALPNLRGVQVFIDIFPEQPKKRSKTILTGSYQEFQIVRLPLLEQRWLWEALQRVLNISKLSCCEQSLVSEICDISFEKITPPRNHFLYKAHFWPLDDLVTDSQNGESQKLLEAELDPSHAGFLIQLNFYVYKIFEQLLSDFSKLSAVIDKQWTGARFSAGTSPERDLYEAFFADRARQ